MPSALTQLLGLAGARRFHKESWPDQHFVVHRPKSALPEFLAQGPLAGFEALATVYEGRLQIAGGRGDDHLQFSVSDAPASYLRQIGLTVFFGDDVAPYAPGALEWLRAMEDELGSPSGIAAIRAFASAPSGGLEPHYDQGETLIVQLEGQKRIWLSPNTSYPTAQFITGKVPAEVHYPEFADGFPSRPPKKGFWVTLKPGSVLFIPRGMWHRTEAGGRSYSVSICVDMPNPLEVLLPYLQRSLQHSPEWRRPLYGAWGGRRGVQTERLSAMLAELGTALLRANPHLALDGADRQRAQNLVRPGTRFQRIPTTRLRTGKLNGRPVLIASAVQGEEVKVLLSVELLPAVRWLMTRRAAFKWEEFRELAPRVPAADTNALAGTLVEQGVLQPLFFEPLS